MQNDLISRSALLFVLDNDFFPANGEFRNAMDIARFAIQDATAVDAVEVVRCRQCNHMIEKGWCSLHSTPMNRDDFCSYGERRADDGK
jgi:hypothetical protein